MKHLKIKKALACVLATVLATGAIAEGIGLLSKAKAGTGEIAIYEKADENTALVEYITTDTVAKIIDAVETDDGELWYKIIWSHHDDRALEGYAPAEELEFLLYNNAATFILDDTPTVGLEAFPEDYQELLAPLQNAHPNWTFVPYYVEPTWDEVLVAETTMKIDDPHRNYVHTTSAFSMKNMLVYNWGTDTFSGTSGPNWIIASMEAIAYYLEPRNFITEENIFLFESMLFNEDLHTVDLIEAVLKGTFMYKAYVDVTEEEDFKDEVEALYLQYQQENSELQTLEETEQSSEEQSEEESGSEMESETETSSSESSNNLDISETQESPRLLKTYAELFVEIGRMYDVSPVMLASRCRQEQGVNGDSALISGTVVGYEGYYNYFNSAASGVTKEDIIINGLEEAKKQGWSSIYKSLKGGSLKIAANYILQNQDTLYLQKFDVDPNDKYGMYWHQYMGAIASPAAEGRTARRSYIDLGVLDSYFVFKIPVYTDRPETPAELPTDDTNPNNYLSSITLNDGQYSLNFEYLKQTYELAVPYECQTLNINATPVSTRATVEGGGAKELAVGANEFVITVTSQKGEKRYYTLTVTRSEQPGAADVRGQVKTWNNLKDIVVKLYDATLTDEQIREDMLAENPTLALDYSVILGDAVASENQFAIAYELKNVVNGTYKVAIFKPGRYVVAIETVTVAGIAVNTDTSMWLYGDVNYDGKVNVSDITQITRYVSKKTSVFDSGDDKTKMNRLLATDIIGDDNKVTVQDITQFVRHISKKASILDTMK